MVDTVKTRLLLLKSGFAADEFPRPLLPLYLCIPLSPLLHSQRTEHCGIP